MYKLNRNVISSRSWLVHHILVITITIHQFHSLLSSSHCIVIITTILYYHSSIFHYYHFNNLSSLLPFISMVDHHHNPLPSSLPFIIISMFHDQKNSSSLSPPSIFHHLSIRLIINSSLRLIIIPSPSFIIPTHHLFITPFINMTHHQSITTISSPPFIPIIAPPTISPHSLSHALLHVPLWLHSAHAHHSGSTLITGQALGSTYIHQPRCNIVFIKVAETADLFSLNLSSRAKDARPKHPARKKVFTYIYI